ncbi:MAG: ferritin family protein [Candidatus Krumholzibacteriota bacterium]|nr:ferritin family protein [Candidatus Krumholzibacteriota bacterium]
MTEFKSVDDILDFAINNEQKAIDFYTGLADRMEIPAVSKLLLEFAGEEKKHKAKLQEIKAGKTLLAVKDRIMDLKIGDYLVDVEGTPDMDYQNALILAMKREKAAFRMYSNLAARVDGDLREIFLGLAQEEARHKVRFEIEYDEYVLKDN